MLILLVEDDLKRMKELKSCFESRTVKVITVNDMSGALKILRSGKYDFDRVISDVNLEHGSGFALIEEINKDRSIKRVPFFMYSSAPIDKDNRELAEKFGVDHCLIATRPVEIINEALAYSK